MSEAKPAPQRPSVLSLNINSKSALYAAFMPHLKSGGIFIPPDIVSAASIENESKVEGVAVLNFDKKRSTWGWKAINCRQRQPSRP